MADESVNTILIQRKTNLFYSDSDINSEDFNNFLTFSNYTECLTGAFLSLSKKLFPTRFLCLNIPKLNDVNNNIDKAAVSGFIKNYLVAYYENKLAFTHDDIIHKSNTEKNFSVKPEQVIKPFSWLLETILKFDKEASIVYDGDIAEQDYNGTYTDTICVIDTKRCNNKYNLITNSVKADIELDDYSEVNGRDKLHGWIDTVPDLYKDVTPIFDDSGTNYQPTYEYSGISTIEDSQISSLEFNVIIPLFCMVDSSYAFNNDNLYNKFDYYNNVPIGIWFADEKPIYIDISNKFSSSWSLVISSQFKPTPKTSLIESNNYIDNRADSYATFAEILYKQNEISNSLLEFTKQYNNLINKINNLEVMIKETNKMASYNNIENIKNITKNVKSNITTINSLYKNIGELSDRISVLENKN